MDTTTIRLMPAAIVCGLVPRMRLLWLAVDDSAHEATTGSSLEIRVRLCDAACGAHAGNDNAAARCDSTVASCIAEAAP